MGIPREPYPFRNPLKRFAIGLFDLTGYLISRNGSRLPKRLDPSAIRKVLVMRLDQLGDIVMTRPAVSALRNLYPEAEIDLAIPESAVALFRDDPAVDRIHTVSGHWFEKGAGFRKQWRTWRDLLTFFRAEKYDLAVDFRGDLRHILLMTQAGISSRAGFGVTGGGFLLTHRAEEKEGRHQIDRNMALIRCLGGKQEPPLNPIPFSTTFRKTFETAWGESIRSRKPSRLVIHPGAGLESKRWPADCFAELIERIRKDGNASLIIIGNESEARLPVLPSEESESIWDLRGRTNLAELVLLIEYCDAFLGHDSGPAHLAAAQGLPVFCLFSPENNPDVWRPASNRLKLLLPAKKGTRSGKLEDLTVGEVYDSFHGWFDHLKGSSSHA